ncbi:MAG: AGE family epimerase/isomerase [Bacteroidales bacterium]|nr:AGE family epimerase/isomerase [Bacteroidales bacterium]
MNVKQYLTAHRDYCRAELTDNIMPFWMKHGLDRENGGVYTCLDRDGTLMDSTKSVWFQGRFGFTTAFAYNNIKECAEGDLHLLEASRSCLDFIDQHCFDTDGHMFFEVMADGTPLRKRRYVFSEGFAAIANSEYALATGDKSRAERAVEIFESIIRMLNTPDFLPAKYLPTQESRGHSITMILVNTAARIREAVERFDIGTIKLWDGREVAAWDFLTGEIDKSIHALRTYFMHPEYKALLEYVGPNGEFIDNINGRLINPGHCIETAWFILEEAKYRKTHPRPLPEWRGEDTPANEGVKSLSPDELVEMGLTILEWSWDWGWDEQYGGIINFRDCKGFPQQDYSQDMKFWWPQCETMIACLYAYQATGDEQWLHRHQQITEWTLGHFPDREYGEWYGYLHRDGTVAQPAKGNIFKGPFHVPRMFTKSFMLCEELLAEL